MDGDSIQLQHDAVFALEAFDEFFAELLQAFLFAVVAEYLLFEHFLSREVVVPGELGGEGDCEDG